MREHQIKHIKPFPDKRRPERILLCGWRRDVDDVVAQLDQLVKKGSEVRSPRPLSSRAVQPLSVTALCKGSL
jgi:hypothetical protein